MTYESEMHKFDRRHIDVMAAWGVYAMTVAGLGMSALITLFA
jgi:hypothetical protein